MDSFSRNRSILYRELYHHLTASDGSATRPAPASAIDLPRPLARALVHFYSLLRGDAIAALDESLADQVAVAVSSWFASIWEDLLLSPPMEMGSEDETRVDLDLMERLDASIRRWPEHSQAWTRIQNDLTRATTPVQRDAVHARFRSLRNELVRSRRDLRRERALRLVASPLADHLRDALPRLQRQQDQLRNVLGVQGRWNVLEAEPPDINWDALTRSYRSLDNAPGLRELCTRIVRGVDPAGVREYEVQRDVPEMITSEEDQGLGMVKGLTCGTDITATLPAELGLLAFPDTEDLFSQKRVEGKLLTLDHQRRVKTCTWTNRKVRETVRRPRPQGSVVLCIDTSGSMRGTPEDITRAAILGFVSAGIVAQRRVTVLAHSRDLQTIETSPDTRESPTESQDSVTGAAPPAASESLIHRLSTFLDGPLADGTDISPAMEQALNIVEGNTTGDSFDVLVISDVAYPKIPPRHLNRMYNLQTLDSARFHALTIGDSPLFDPLNVFDYRWFFNTESRPDLLNSAPDRPIGVDTQTVP